MMNEGVTTDVSWMKDNSKIDRPVFAPLHGPPLFPYPKRLAFREARQEEKVDSEINIVQIHSGGFDSTTLLHWLLSGHQKVNVTTVTVDYGQKMRKELQAAARTAEWLDLEHHVVDVSDVEKLISEASLIEGREDAPSGHHMDDSMIKNMVPNRNMFLLAVAGVLAVDQECHYISYGCHEENYAYDSQWPFIENMVQTFQNANRHRIKLITPLMGLEKAALVKIGERLNIPYELTWSCYRGEEKSCGQCGACVRRLEAFWLAENEDPLEYEDREYWKTESQHYQHRQQDQSKSPWLR
jgi:7-cyano-7-deazaguanine synthase